MDKEALLKGVENSLLSGNKDVYELCDAFRHFSSHDKLVYQTSFRFIGCKDIILQPPFAIFVEEADRIKAARLILLSLSVHTSEPTWSSRVIEVMWKSILEVSNSKVNDLYKAVFSLLSDFECDLTRTLANFIQDITYNRKIETLSLYKHLYDSDNFDWIHIEIDKGISTAQAYLVAYALPKRLFTSEFCVPVLQILIATEFWNEIIMLIGEILTGYKSKQLLVEWLNQDIPSPYREDIEKLLE